MVVLSLYRDVPESQSVYLPFEQNDILARLKSLDARVLRKGLESLDPARNKLIPIGTEINAKGRVTKNSYGVLHLSWRAQQAGDWPERIQTELEEIRDRIRKAHGTKLRFLIWAGMGGSAEDKSMYSTVGLLAKGPRVYVLDSTDPAKLKHILDDIQKRCAGNLTRGLQSTLVVGMAMGMTSYEPVVNLEKLYALFQKHKIDSRPNFIYMTLPGSLLDRFAGPRGYHRVELQLDSGNTTAGRHSGPLTRGSLYPLGLAGVDLRQWIEGTYLDRDTISTAWRLAAFLQAQGKAGRDKATLLLPNSWEGAGIWTKQDFEESLGKSEDLGIKIITGEKIRMAYYRRTQDSFQDRVFLAIQRKNERRTDTDRIAMLRRAGYPTAVLTVPGAMPLSGYMQFIHYVVFGLGYLRDMNFVTQPSVELYKAITSKLHKEGQEAGGIRSTRSWKRFEDSASTIVYRAGLRLHHPYLKGILDGEEKTAPQAYARFWMRLREQRKIDHGELTFFGDTRYSPQGKTARRCLDRGADAIRAHLQMPVDVYEGPAMNHSYHEMIIGHGKCFSTVLLSDKSESIPTASYDAEYHNAQFLATQLALADRGRAVAALVLRDLSAASLKALDEFFRQVAVHLKTR